MWLISPQWNPPSFHFRASSSLPHTKYPNKSYPSLHCMCPIIKVLKLLLKITQLINQAKNNDYVHDSVRKKNHTYRKLEISQVMHHVVSTKFGNLPWKWLGQLLFSPKKRYATSNTHSIWHNRYSALNYWHY